MKEANSINIVYVGILNNEDRKVVHKLIDKQKLKKIIEAGFRLEDNPLLRVCDSDILENNFIVLNDVILQ